MHEKMDVLMSSIMTVMAILPPLPMRGVYSSALTSQRLQKSVNVRNLGLLAAVIIVHELILSASNRNFLDTTELHLSKNYTNFPVFIQSVFKI